jgi:glutamine amidotransferase
VSLAIIDTGCANIFSVESALSRLGVDYVLAGSPEAAGAAERLILPGVGAAGPAMARLNLSGWASSLKTESRPVLGICLGLQLLFERSAEGGVETLGIVPGDVEAMTAPRGGVLPHMGWNKLSLERADDPLVADVPDGSHVYFVHGFAAPVGSATLAATDYGSSFSAMIRHGNFMGCQFHPERSGAVGSRILRNFAELDA